MSSGRILVSARWWLLAIAVAAGVLEGAACRRDRPADPPVAVVDGPVVSMQSPAALTVRVLVLNFDPRIPTAGDRPLHQALNWNDPRALARDYSADVERASGGLVRFQIVEWRDVDAFHRKADGFIYSAGEYVRNHASGAGWHEPDAADYRATFQEHGIIDRVNARAIDEVWFFGGPYFGYSESAMAGPGAFDVNGAVFDDVRAARAFVVMGFNYERGVAEMLENLCHRVESTLSRAYGGWRAEILDTAWARFAANQAQSRTAGLGSCHWPPNAAREYEYDNPRTAMSTADAWTAYPRLEAPPRPVNRDTWGGPDYARNYFKWWFAHLPRAGGQTEDGREANWWKYVFDVNQYEEGGLLLSPNQRR